MLPLSNALERGPGGEVISPPGSEVSPKNPSPHTSRILFPIHPQNHAAVQLSGEDPDPSFFIAGSL